MQWNPVLKFCFKWKFRKNVLCNNQLSKKISLQILSIEPFFKILKQNNSSKKLEVYIST